MRSAKKMMLVIAAVGSLACGAAAQMVGFGGVALDDQVPVFDTREAKVAWIEQAVAEYTAQAEAAPARRAGEVSATGAIWQHDDRPAAYSVWNADPRASVIDCSVDVALLHADSTSFADDVVSKLFLDPRIASVTVFDVTGTTPTFAQTAGFDAVMTWSDFDFDDAVAMGNLVSKLTRFGKGVVVSQFCHQDSVEARRLAGDFLANQEYCITPVDAFALTGSASLGTVHVPGSPLMQGVGSFAGGTSSWRASGALHPSAQRIADWSTGEILVATRFDLNGRRVDLGFFPPSSDALGTAWDSSTQGARLMANALVYAGGCPKVGDAPGCGPAVFSQTTLGSGAGFITSNTPINLQPVQGAEDFVLGQSEWITAVTLWGNYDSGNSNVPQAQHFQVNFYNSVGGLPGSVIHTTVAVGVPEPTGLGGVRPYRVVLHLPEPFLASAGVTYWVSPLADTPQTGSPFVVWGWAGSLVPGAVAFRFDGESAWELSSGGFLVELCGHCFCCPGDNDVDGDIDLDDLQLLLFYFGAVCR